MKQVPDYMGSNYSSVGNRVVKEYFQENLKVPFMPSFLG